MKKPGPFSVCNIALVLIAVCATAIAEAPDPDPARFAAEIAAFAEWDSKNSVPRDAILFVGSSSIRLWATAAAFPEKSIINRGFGGAELSDVVFYYEQVIKPYAPRQIVLYAGDNDIGNGKSANQVFEDFRALVSQLRVDYPRVELVFLSIKPSKDRWDKWPIMAVANLRIREHAAADATLKYVDLATPLLDANGQPKDVYDDDGLHLDAAGYQLWQAALAPYLD